MLWSSVRKARGYRLLSSALSVMLLLMLAAPGIAAFADETQSSSKSDLVAPVLVPELEIPIVPVPEKEPVPVDEKVDLVVMPEVVDPEATPAKETPVTDEPAVVLAENMAAPKAAVEVFPVTVAAIAPLGATINTGGGPRADFPAPITVGAGCDLTTRAIFWAGQNYEAGTVSVRNDADNLYVTFTTTGGWTMGLTHLYVGLTQPSTYAPGQFPYQTNHADITSYTYTISLAGLGAVPGDTIYVAAHAEVENGTQGETAWAGQGQWPGLLFAHVVQECVDEPDPADLTVTKFNDLNGNGEMDEGEPVIAGIDFTATMGQTVLTQTTDAMGKVTFVDLADGTYTITETLPEGWVATTEIPFDITVVADQDANAYVGNREVIVEPDPADLTVTKFNDLNGNGEMDEGEPVIAGIDFTATMGQTVLTQTTDAMGKVTFVDLADGTYTITETLPEGWVATTEIPFDITVVADQDANAYVGNREVVTPDDVTKTFRLLYPSAHFGVTFYAGYTMGESSSMVELTGRSPYEAQVQFPYGTEITVSWYALYGSELVLLGTGEPEVLTMDIVNVYSYAASVAGYKFNDLDADGVWGEGEPGIGGWGITLYRQAVDAPSLAAQAVPAGFEYYAATTTLADGSYLFSGVLPGTYYVAEENRAGWIMTVGTDGAFEISNGASVDGLVFGNAEEGLPFTPPDLAIEKAADVTTSSPGALITYTLTYRNVGLGSASDYRIVDDFDERYVAVVDSGGGQVVDGTIVWELAGPLAASDGDMTLVYTVRVLADIPEGKTDVMNIVVISHPDDENKTNDTADALVVVDDPALPFTPQPEPEVEEEFLPYTGGGALLGSSLLFAMLLGLGLRRVARTT